MKAATRQKPGNHLVAASLAPGSLVAATLAPGSCLAATWLPPLSLHSYPYSSVQLWEVSTNFRTDNNHSFFFMAIDDILFCSLEYFFLENKTQMLKDLSGHSPLVNFFKYLTKKNWQKGKSSYIILVLCLLKLVGKEGRPNYFRQHFPNWFSMSDKKEKQSKLRK